MENKIIFTSVIAIMLVLVLTLVVSNQKLRSDISDFKRSNISLRVIASKQREQALNYQLIALELSYLCDLNQSSRKAKNESEKYFELLKNVE